MNRDPIHPITWNMKPGTNSYADGLAQCLIGSRIVGHPLAVFGRILHEACLDSIRRSATTNKGA